MPQLSNDRFAAAEGLKSEWSGDQHVAIDLPVGRDVGTVWLAIEQLAVTEKAYWEWGDVEEFRTL